MPLDAWQRYRYWILVVFAVPSFFALSLQAYELSVEYLPHFEGVLVSALPVAIMVLLLLFRGRFDRRYGEGSSKLLGLLVLPLFVVMQIGASKNDPTRVRLAVDLLEKHAEKASDRFSGGHVSPDALASWLRHQRGVRDRLNSQATQLGSTRVAVYSYAIDASLELLLSETPTIKVQEAVRINHRNFWKRLGLNLSPHLVPEFVQCYRESDRPEISHKGVLGTVAFQSCFGSISARP